MKTNKLKASQAKKLEAYLFILPAIFYVLLVMGYPLLYNGVLSFQNMDVKNLKSGTAVFVGLQNYIELFKNETFRRVLGNTFEFTIFSLIFQFSIGFLFALFFKKDFKLSGPIRGLILIAYMMPMSVTGLLGKNIFMNAGLINDLLSRIGITGPEWLTSTTWSMTAVIIMNCWVGIPFNMLLLLSGLSNINPEIYESAMIDGATPKHRFFYITHVRYRSFGQEYLYECRPHQRPAEPHRHHRTGMADQHHLVHDSGDHHELLGGHSL